MAATGIFINKKWKLEPIRKDVLSSCKICGNSKDVRYFVIPKSNKPYGVFLCSDCIDHITIIYGIEVARAGAKIDHSYAINNPMYDYEEAQHG